MTGRGMRRRGLSPPFIITAALRTLHSEDFSFGDLVSCFGCEPCVSHFVEGKFALISCEEANPPGLRHLFLPEV